MDTPLVYLDWSNIVHFTEARLTDPAAYEAPLRTWRTSSAALAFSRVHLTEMRRHDRAEARAERVRTVQQLLPVRTDVPMRGRHGTGLFSMTEREILSAIVLRNTLPLTPDEAVSLDRNLRANAMRPFPLQWDDAPSVNVLRSYDDASFRASIDLAHLGVTHAVETLHRDASLPYRRPQLRDLSTTLISQVALEEVEHQCDAALSEARRANPTPLPRDVWLTLVGAYVEEHRQLHRRAAQVGLQRAWAEMRGIDAGPLPESAFLDDVERTWHFRQTVGSVVLRVLDVSPPRATSLAMHLSVAECPGTWLSQAVDLEIRKRESATDPSSAYDLDHLVYFPYVDAFYSDKRIRDHVKLALRRTDCPAGLRTRDLPLTASNSAEALAKSFESLRLPARVA